MNTDAIVALVMAGTALIGALGGAAVQIAQATKLRAETARLSIQQQQTHESAAAAAQGTADVLTQITALHTDIVQVRNSIGGTRADIRDLRRAVDDHESRLRHLETGAA